MSTYNLSTITYDPTEVCIDVCICIDHCQLSVLCITLHLAYNKCDTNCKSQILLGVPKVES